MDDGTTGRELWTSDGTESGTAILLDIYPGAAWSDPNELSIQGGTLFFAADDGQRGNELYTMLPEPVLALQLAAGLALLLAGGRRRIKR